MGFFQMWGEGQGFGTHRTSTGLIFMMIVPFGKDGPRRMDNEGLSSQFERCLSSGGDIMPRGALASEAVRPRRSQTHRHPGFEEQGHVLQGACEG